MNRTSSSVDTNDDLIDALQEVANHLGLIRQVLDEIFTELQWANQNPRDADHSSGACRQITSMPTGLTTFDWADHFNRYTAVDVPVPTEKASVQIPGAQSPDANPENYSDPIRIRTTTEVLWQHAAGPPCKDSRRAKWTRGFSGRITHYTSQRIPSVHLQASWPGRVIRAAESHDTGCDRCRP